MQDTVYGDNYVEVIYNKIVNHTRWRVTHEVVFEHEKVFYLTTYSEGTTENQDGLAYEYCNNGVVCTVVEPVERTIIEYKPVGDRHEQEGEKK